MIVEKVSIKGFFQQKVSLILLFFRRFFQGFESNPA